MNRGTGKKPPAATKLSLLKIPPKIIGELGGALHVGIPLLEEVTNCPDGQE
jgi:hypothetical protein